MMTVSVLVTAVLMKTTTSGKTRIITENWVVRTYFHFRCCRQSDVVEDVRCNLDSMSSATIQPTVVYVQDLLTAITLVEWRAHARTSIATVVSVLQK